MLILKADGLQIRPNVKTYLFANGVMEGKNATFVMSNGDVFTGEFRNDRLYKGRYTIKSDGSYFEGTFKDGQPDAGAWYDKNEKNYEATHLLQQPRQPAAPSG